MKFNVIKYDLYLFDLDGTLINTEYLHHQAYQNALLFFNSDINLNFNDYCKYAHWSDISMKEFIENNLDVNFEKFYQKKKEYYIQSLETVELMQGVNDLLNTLFNNNIKTVIVTHSDRETINLILQKIPILNKIDVIITKDDYINKKPHPEPYLNALYKFPNCSNPIGFEDSYKGYMSLERSKITSVFVNSISYPYFNIIKPINYIDNFDQLYNIQIKNTIVFYQNFIDNIFTKIIDGLLDFKTYIPNILKQIIPLIQNSNGNIYLTGIGKCGHVCKKCVSTWQSLGLSCHYLNIPDLFHGDFGILKKNDLIIYISNSGNTIELLQCANYIKTYFKICQICITMNKDSKIEPYVNFLYNITNNIIEFDSINMAPTSSSLIFMTLLDLIGCKLAEETNITIEKFKLNHPGGDLGKKSNNIIDSVVIVASGQGSRLYPYTKYIPKILVNFNNQPFMEHLIIYWKKFTDNIIIIINSQYYELIKFYTSKYSNITIKIFNELTGTADTINNSITNEYYNKNILFTWCDIVPNYNLDIKQLDKSAIFTYGNQCRYGIINNKIKKVNNGNIIGMYYIKNYNGLLNYMLGDDICDIFDNNYLDYSEFKLENIIDIGELNKYSIYLNNDDNFKTRFFNDIILKNTSLIKKSNCDQGNIIIENEINWYTHINNKYDFIPQIININKYSFEIQKIDSVPLYKIFNNMDHEKQVDILNKIFIKLDKLHANTHPIDKESYLEDIKIEIYEKIYNRLAKVESILQYFKNINSVKNLKVIDVNIIIDICYNNIRNNIISNYSLIHGDCQFSNILFDEMNDNIYFIDPRGYFGKSKLFGPKEYDYAKIMYALTGYDDFNNNNAFYIDISNNNLSYNFKSYDLLLSKLNEITNKNIINKITLSYLIIIWLGLAQYNENNPLKCITSYYHSIYLFNYFYDKLIA